MSRDWRVASGESWSRVASIIIISGRSAAAQLADAKHWKLEPGHSLNLCQARTKKFQRLVLNGECLQTAEVEAEALAGTATATASWRIGFIE